MRDSATHILPRWTCRNVPYWRVCIFHAHCTHFHLPAPTTGFKQVACPAAYVPGNTYTGLPRPAAYLHSTWTTHPTAAPHPALLPGDFRLAAFPYRPKPLWSPSAMTFTTPHVPSFLLPGLPPFFCVLNALPYSIVRDAIHGLYSQDLHSPTYLLAAVPLAYGSYILGFCLLVQRLPIVTRVPHLPVTGRRHHPRPFLPRAPALRYRYLPTANQLPASQRPFCARAVANNSWRSFVAMRCYISAPLLVAAHYLFFFTTDAPRLPLPPIRHTSGTCLRCLPIRGGFWRNAGRSGNIYPARTTVWNRIAGAFA